MAILANIQSGNFTASSTWGVVDNTAIVGETATQAVTNVFVSGANFTPAAGTYLGIGVRVLQTASVPIGTFTARLSIAGVAIAGTTVTINVSDLFNGTNGMCGWVFFKFAAPVVLAAVATNVDLQCSTTGQVTCYRGATTGNWARILVSNVNAAPAANDSLIIKGEYTGAGTSNTLTVTMDNTAATNFAQVDVAGKGILNFGTVASTAYQLRMAGIMYITGQGQLNVGTLATPMPATSSGIIRFVNTTNVDFGMEIRGNAVVNTYGETKIGRAYLNADAAAAATTITTDVSTSWLNGDEVALASTTTTATQSESKTLTANATGTSVPITALGFAHSGTNPTRAELINLTRNVKIIGTSLTLCTYINNINGPSATVSFNYTEFQYLGSNVANKRGIDIATTGVGSCSIIGCALKNFEVSSAAGIVIGTSVANTTINDCVFYRMSTAAVAFSSSAQASVSVTNCWAFICLVAGNALFTYSSPLPTFSNIVAVSSNSGFGITFSTNDIISSVISNLTAHSNAAGGISFTANSQMSTPPVISNITCWKNTTVNIRFNNCNNLVFDTINVFSSSIANIDFSSNVSTDLILNNITCNAGTSPTSADGIRVQASCARISITNSSFGVGSVHPIADINSIFVRGFLGLNLYNCVLNSATEVTGLNIASYNSYVSSSKHDGVSGAFKTYTPLGVITKDYVIFDTATPGLSASTRLTPTSTASKLTSDKTIAVPAGRQLKVTIGVRTSVVGDGVAYNGALPQLVVKKNHSVGLTSDTLLTTATVASSGAFEFISGTTPVAIDDGAFTFCVTCDGTAGWTNVDSWKVEVI